MTTDDLEGLILEIDLEQRELRAYHKEELSAELHRRLEGLKLGARLIDRSPSAPPQASQGTIERQTLILVLLINFALFVLEGTMGLISGSMGLAGDSLDMLADALVYGLSLYAIGRSIKDKKRVAMASGYTQIALAVYGLYEVLSRFYSVESAPDFWAMIYTSLLALAGNATCLYLLQRTKDREAHIQASLIFSANDVLINIGVIVSAGLVYWLKSPYPDLIIGSLIFALVISGAVRILRLGRS